MAGAQSWDDYWRREGAAAAFRRASETFRPVWSTWLSDTLTENPDAIVLDAACGAGAVTREVVSVAERLNASPAIVCVDIAPAAVASVNDELAIPLAANALALPFVDRAFDAIVSQYGVEYAGPSALAGLSSHLAPKGRILILAHLKDGAIAHECAENAAVLSTLIETDLLAKVSDLFDALVMHEARKHDAGAEFRRVAGICGQAAVRRACPASEFAQRLFQDCGRLLQQPQRYDSHDIKRWLAGQQQAITAYYDRMLDMLESAMDQTQVQQMIDAWRGDGLVNCSATSLTLDGDDQPAAWRLEAVRPN